MDTFLFILSSSSFPFQWHIVCCADIIFYIFHVLKNQRSSGLSHIKYHVSFIHFIISVLFFLQSLLNNTRVIFHPIFITSLLSSCTSFFITLSFLLGFAWGHAYPIFINYSWLFIHHCWCTDTVLSYSTDSSWRELVHTDIMGHWVFFYPNLSCGDGVLSISIFFFSNLW